LVFAKILCFYQGNASQIRRYDDERIFRQARLHSPKVYRWQIRVMQEVNGEKAAASVPPDCAALPWNYPASIKLFAPAKKLRVIAAFF
jgi:hypothetical protein